MLERTGRTATPGSPFPTFYWWVGLLTTFSHVNKGCEMGAIQVFEKSCTGQPQISKYYYYICPAVSILSQLTCCFLLRHEITNMWKKECTMVMLSTFRFFFFIAEIEGVTSL